VAFVAHKAIGIAADADVELNGQSAGEDGVSFRHSVNVAKNEEKAMAKVQDEKVGCLLRAYLWGRAHVH
jgi:hypothetical protein